MRIVSLVMRVKDEDMDDARQGLLQVPGVQVHAEDRQNGKMIITIEDGEGYSTADSIILAHKVPQILSVTLAYEFSEDDGIIHRESTQPCQPSATGASTCH